MTPFNRVACAVFLTLTVMASPARAILGDYGVVIGTVVHDTDSNIATTKNPHLEPQQTEGHYPHYVFNVDTPAGRYQCVIDIFSRLNTSDRQVIRYRVVPLGLGNHAWDTVLGLADGYHQLQRDATHGALDYFRHPGINTDAMTLAWKSDPNLVVGVNLPAFDDLFNNVRRVWAFGQPYTSGLGIHNIHQNQGNVPNNVLQAPQGPNGEDHSAADGLWQDGGVILEYDPIWVWRPGPPPWVSKWLFIRKVYEIRDKWFPGWHSGHWILVADRKLLMTQFAVQEDFTFDTAATQDGYSFNAGDGYTPLYIYDFSINAKNQSIAAGGSPMTGQHSSGAGVSKKIRILVTPQSGHPVLYGRVGAIPTQSQYDAKSDQPVGEVETIHTYSATPQLWNWIVVNAGPGACTFDWDELDADP